MRAFSLMASIDGGSASRDVLVEASRSVCRVPGPDEPPPSPLPVGYIETLVLALGGGVRSTDERLGVLALLVHLVRERSSEASSDGAVSWQCSTCAFSTVDADAPTCALCGADVERRRASLTDRIEALVDRPRCAATDGATVLAAFERHGGYSALEVLVSEVIALHAAGDATLLPRVLELLGALVFLGQPPKKRAAAAASAAAASGARPSTLARFGRRRLRNVDAFKILADFLARLPSRRGVSGTEAEVSAAVIDAVVRWMCAVLCAHPENFAAVREIHPVASLIDALDVLDDDAARRSVIQTISFLVRSQRGVVPTPELCTLCCVLLTPVDLPTLGAVVDAVDCILALEPTYAVHLSNAGLHDTLCAWLRAATGALETDVSAPALEASADEIAEAEAEVGAKVGERELLGPSIALPSSANETLPPVLRCVCVLLRSADAATSPSAESDGIVASLQRTGCFDSIWRLLRARAVSNGDGELRSSVIAVVDAVLQAALRMPRDARGGGGADAGADAMLRALMNRTLGATRHALRHGRFACAEALVEIVTKHMTQDCDSPALGVPVRSCGGGDAPRAVVACQDAFADARGFRLAADALRHVASPLPLRGASVERATAHVRAFASLGIALTFLYAVATAFHRRNCDALRCASAAQESELDLLGVYLISSVERAGDDRDEALTSVCAALDSLALNGRVLPPPGGAAPASWQRPWLSVPEALLLEMKVVLAVAPGRLAAVLRKAVYLAGSPLNQAALSSAGGTMLVLKRLLCEGDAIACASALDLLTHIASHGVSSAELHAWLKLPPGSSGASAAGEDEDSEVAGRLRWRRIGALVSAATRGARRHSARGTGTGRPVAAIHFCVGSGPSALICAEAAAPLGGGLWKKRRADDAMWPLNTASGYTLSAWVRVEEWHASSAAAAPTICLLQVRTDANAAADLRSGGRRSTSSLVEIRVSCVRGDAECGAIRLLSRRGAGGRGRPNQGVVFPGFRLAKGVWTHLAVSHAKPRALSGASTATLIVNGKLIASIDKVAYPAPARISRMVLGVVRAGVEPSPASFPASSRAMSPSSPPAMSPSPSGLHWALGPTYLLSCSTDEDAISDLVTLGISYDGLFNGSDGQGTELVAACEAGLFNPPTLHSMLSNMDGTSEAIVRVQAPFTASQIILAISPRRFLAWSSPRWSEQLGEMVGELRNCGSAWIKRIAIFGGVAFTAPHLASSAAQNLCSAAPLALRFLKEAATSEQLVTAMRFFAVLCAGDVDSIYSMEGLHAFSSAALLLREKQHLLNRDVLEVVFACVLGRTPQISSDADEDGGSRGGGALDGCSSGGGAASATSFAARCPLVIANLAAAEHLLLRFELWEGAREGLQGVLFGWLLDAIGGLERHVNLAQLRRLHLVQRLVAYVTQSELPEGMFADVGALLRMCLVGPDASREEQRRRFALVARTCISLLEPRGVGTTPWRTRLLEDMLKLLVEVATQHGNDDVRSVRKSLFEAIDYELLFVLINDRGTHSRTNALAFTMLRAMVVGDDANAAEQQFAAVDGYNKLAEVLPCFAAGPPAATLEGGESAAAMCPVPRNPLNGVFRRVWMLAIGKVRDDGPLSRAATHSWLVEACTVGNIRSLNMEAVGTLLDVASRIVSHALVGVHRVGVDVPRATLDDSGIACAAEAVAALAALYDASPGFRVAWSATERGETQLLFAKLVRLLRSARGCAPNPPASAGGARGGVGGGAGGVADGNAAASAAAPAPSALGGLVRTASALLALRLDETLASDAAAPLRLDAVLEDGMHEDVTNSIVRLLLTRGRGEADVWPKWSGNLETNTDVCRIAVQHLARAPVFRGDLTPAASSSELEIALLLLSFVIELIDVAAVRDAQGRAARGRKRAATTPAVAPNAPLLGVLDILVAWILTQRDSPWSWRARVFELLLARRDLVFSPRSSSKHERKFVATLCRGLLRNYADGAAAAATGGGAGRGAGGGATGGDAEGEGSALAVASLIDVLMMELLQRKEAAVADVLTLYFELPEDAVAESALIKSGSGGSLSTLIRTGSGGGLSELGGSGSGVLASGGSTLPSRSRGSSFVSEASDDSAAVRSRASSASSDDGASSALLAAASIDDVLRVYLLLEAHIKQPASGVVNTRGRRKYVAGSPMFATSIEMGRATKVMQADVFTFMLAPVVWQADTMASTIDALPQPRSQAFVRETLVAALAGSSDGQLLALVLDRHLGSIGWKPNAAGVFDSWAPVAARKRASSSVLARSSDRVREQWLATLLSVEARDVFRSALAARSAYACLQETQQLQKQLQHLLDRSTFARRRCRALDAEFDACMHGVASPATHAPHALSLTTSAAAVEGEWGDGERGDGVPRDEIALSEGEGPCRMRVKLFTAHPRLKLRKRNTRPSSAQVGGASAATVRVADHVAPEREGAATAAGAVDAAPEASAAAAPAGETESSIAAVEAAAGDNSPRDAYPEIDEKLGPLLTLGDVVEFQCNCSRITPYESTPATFLMCNSIRGSGRGYLVTNYLLADGDNLPHGASLESRVADATLGNRPGALHFEEGSGKAAGDDGDDTNIEHRCIKWSFDDVRAVYSRRYLLRQIALEFFLLDGSTHLVVFATGELRDCVQRELLKRCRPTVRSNPEAVHKAALKAWLDGKISNFEYLMDLNTTSGRSFNDLTQYPVFPWILADYTSSTLDLTKASTFRDLAKPLGAMTENRASTFRERYDVLSDTGGGGGGPRDGGGVRPGSPPLGTSGIRRGLSALLRKEERPRAGSAGERSIAGKTSPPPFWRRRARSAAGDAWDDAVSADGMGTPPPFHYGTHYSSAAIVLHYMLRLQPFAQRHVQLQGGKFDQSDRLFSDVGAAWRSAAGISAGGHALQDVKELIPEFFCTPSFLCNVNGYDLGSTAGGRIVGDVVLPPWAHNSPREFIRVHREALECEYVSTHLHHWIDLIFGAKQRGQAAIDSINVFYWLTYEDRVDLDAVEDPGLRRAYVEQIHEFGQTPTQLFKKAHPKRKVTRKDAGGGGIGLTPPSEGDGDAMSKSVHTAPQRLVASLVRSTVGAPVLAIGEQSVTRSGRSGLVAVAGSARGCTLRMPEQTEAVLWGGGDVVEQCDSGAAAEGSSGGGSSAAVAPLPNELCVCTVRVVNVGGSKSVRPREEQKCEVASVHEGLHVGGVGTACMTESGETLVTGGLDGTLRVWSLRAARRARTFGGLPKGSGWRGLLQKEMSTVLCGHRAPIRFVAASDAFSVLVSSCAGGECLLWDLWSSRLVRRFDIGNAVVGALAIDRDTGRCIVCAGAQLFVCDVNGDRVASADVALAKQAQGAEGEARAAWAITACTISTGDPWDRRNVIVTGHANGAVLMWSVELAVDRQETPAIPPRRASPASASFASATTIASALVAAEPSATDDVPPPPVPTRSPRAPSRGASARFRADTPPMPTRKRPDGDVAWSVPRGASHLVLRRDEGSERAHAAAVSALHVSADLLRLYSGDRAGRVVQWEVN